jgi:hypothetical protein
MSDAGEFFELLSYHDQDFTLDHLVEIVKPSAFEEAEEPDPEPEKDPTTVTKLTVGYDVTEGGVVSKEHRAATFGQGIVSVLA